MIYMPGAVQHTAPVHTWSMNLVEGDRCSMNADACSQRSEVTDLLLEEMDPPKLDVGKYEIIVYVLNKPIHDKLDVPSIGVGRKGGHSVESRHHPSGSRPRVHDPNRRLNHTVGGTNIVPTPISLAIK